MEQIKLEVGGSKIPVHERHDHYWIEDGILHESYMTLRGMRYRVLCEVQLPDCERCEGDILKYIAAEYY